MDKAVLVRAVGRCTGDRRLDGFRVGTTKRRITDHLATKFNDTIAGCSEMLYQIQLWKTGLVCGYPGSMPAADKLQALAKYRRAWQTLDWTSKRVVDLPASGRARALVAGIFALQEDLSNIYTLSLQESPRPCYTKHALDLKPGAKVRWTMDPTQDLLAVFYRSEQALTLALRTLSTNQPHPMACRPTISITVDALAEDEPVTIHIADDVVGVAFRNPGSICIWNWRTGAFLAEVSQSDTDEPDFQFLSPRVFVIAEDLGWIEIYLITPAKAADSEGAVCVAVLRFPDLACPDEDDPTGTWPWSPTALAIHSGPLSPHPIQGSFSPINENRIYLFLSRLESPGGEVRYMRLITHHTTLIEYVSQYVREERTKYIHLDWEDCGPRNTRILEGNEFDWLANAHGERVVLLGVGEDQPQLQVLDFGVIPKDLEEDESDTLILEPTTIHTPFHEPVTTYLPFRRTLLAKGHYFDTLLIDQDHIVVADSKNLNETGKMTVFKF
ncbi:hypothetical protein FB45DRAFT_936533 [Roridomyces roridus]|uniref:Uncharacterized protein n=1 Tax=Roridomyces roridus TaxID=1738132 RepID=A0AAD7FE90_9AGAR|nr:hypothetical protein FB45DRAFT_936533 [Roridomyces roridus]